MKQKTPTLSIITICYNIKDEIERTCKSIVNQTWQDFEWIVVDGGSTDGTVDILKKYQKKMSVLISEPDKGIYNAMNKGIKLAKGKWLNFMNGGDCFATKDVLEKVFKNKDYDADVLYGDMRIVKNCKEIRVNHYPDKVSKQYFRNGRIGHQAAFIKYDLFRQYGLYNEKYRIASDWEKWIVFTEHERVFKHLNMIICDFDGTGIGSNGSALNNQEIASVWADFYRQIDKYYLFGFIPLLSIEEK